MSGVLNVRVGRATSPEALPILSMPLSAVSRQTATLTLPAGAELLSIEADAPLAAAGGDVTLTPMQLARTPVFARASLVRPAATCYFLDDNVFVESEGFWIRGQSRTSLAIAGPGGQPVSLGLTNGGASNQVTVSVAGAPELTFALAPGETREVPLTRGAASGARIDITSAAGFRPSDDGASKDARYLGVFVRLR